MLLKDKIALLARWGDVLLEGGEAQENAIRTAFFHNAWFTPDNCRLAIRRIASRFLNADFLQQWAQHYRLDLHHAHPPKTIALVMAGNIPLVGFHDWLAVLMSGNKALVKLSSKDEHLPRFLWQQLALIQADFAQQSTVFTEHIIQNFDAVIATGSNNSGRYFEHYFAKYPHIIRKNRGSVAVLTGKETPNDIEQLGQDIFTYFGLGCRNVSKLFVPKGYDFSYLLDHLESFSEVMQHHKYKNNYDYLRSLLLLNQTPHYASDFLMLIENKAVSSPLSCVHFEFYDSNDDLSNHLIEQAADIQAVVGEGFIPFGDTQNPSLSDYADKVDTMQFLLQLHTP